MQPEEREPVKAKQVIRFELVILVYKNSEPFIHRGYITRPVFPISAGQRKLKAGLPGSFSGGGQCITIGYFLGISAKRSPGLLAIKSCTNSMAAR